MKRVLKYASDIHLELISDINMQSIKPLWKFNKCQDTLYYLALVGDISNSLDPKLRQFFSKISPVYKNIFYVPGNHEYYNLKNTKSTQEIRDIHAVKKSIRELCQEFDNIVLLDNETFELDEFLIIGSTLWSNIPDSNKFLLQNTINDYNLIYMDKNTKLDVDITNEWNKNSLQFIENAITNTRKNVIVLTHHAPLFSDASTGKYTADPIYINSKNNYAFHNDLHNIIKQPIKLWIYGHTHYTSKFYVNGVIVATNQLGYNEEQEFINFNPNESIDLDLLML